MSASNIQELIESVENLRHEDVNVRAEAFSHLSEIALAIGEERVIKELVPFMTESIEDEDPVLISLASEIGNLPPSFSNASNIHLLLPILGQLIQGENVKVKALALRSLVCIMPKLTVADHLQSHALSIIKEYSSKDWFTSRAASGCMIPVVFKAALDSKTSQANNYALETNLLSIFRRLSTDDAPAVRREVAHGLAGLGRELFLNPLPPANSRPRLEMIKTLSEILISLLKDDQDSIRIQCISSLAVLGEVFDEEMRSSLISQSIATLITDKCWRVRWALSLALPKLLPLTHNPPNPCRGSLAINFDSLLNDPEPEVRAAAASQISVIHLFFDLSTIKNKFIPSIKRLIHDHVQFVRVHIAGAISALTSSLLTASYSRNETNQTKSSYLISKVLTPAEQDDLSSLLVSLLLSLLRDSDQLIDVRLCVIASMYESTSPQNHHRNNQVMESNTAQFHSKFLSSIVSMVNNDQWRVRFTLIMMMKMITKHIEYQVFKDHLYLPCMKLLEDKNYTVRKAASINLYYLSLQYGEKWSIDNVLNYLKTNYFGAKVNFTWRISCLFTYQVMIELQNSFYYLERVRNTSSKITLNDKDFYLLRDLEIDNDKDFHLDRNLSLHLKLHRDVKKYSLASIDPKYIPTVDPQDPQIIQQTNRMATNHNYKFDPSLDRPSSVNIVEMILNDVLNHFLQDKVANVRLALVKLIASSILWVKLRLLSVQTVKTLTDAIQSLAEDEDVDVRQLAGLVLLRFTN